MIRKTNKVSVFLPAICLLLGWASEGIAQNDLPVEQIEVIKHFDARLIESQKYPSSPRLPEADTSERSYTYTLSLSNPKITYLPPQIRPLGLRPEEQPKAYRGFLRAGYGFPNAALADISYLVADSDPLQVLISGHHQSANDKDHYLQKFSSSGGAVDATYHVSSIAAVSGHAGYDLHKVYFYGLEPDDNSSYVDEGRTFKTFTGNVSVMNPEPLAGDINYSGSFDFYNHRDDLSANENGTKLTLKGEKLFAGKHALSLKMIADLTKLKDPIQVKDLNNFFLQPAFAYRKAVFSVSAGINMAVHESETSFYPLVSAAAQISGNRLIAYIEADGGLTKNNFLSLSAINPFIKEHIYEILNTEHRDYRVGLKGKMDEWEYQCDVGYTTAKFLALYRVDMIDYRKFQPLYEDGNFIAVEGSVQTNVIPHLEIGASVSKKFYSLDTLEKAWYLPNFEASACATYMSTDQKLQIRGTVTINGGIPFRDEYDVEGKLKGLFDVSIGADYFFTEHIGAFIHANNLLGNKYARWQYYTTYGINGVAGVLVRI